jgi:hypothetical protein
MQTIINITPISVHIWEANKVVFQLTSLTLGQNATFHWELHGENGLLIQGSSTMSGDDYQGWNNDNPYVVAWICKTLEVEELKQVDVIPEVVVTPDVDTLEVNVIKENIETAAIGTIIAGEGENAPVG